MKQFRLWFPNVVTWGCLMAMGSVFLEGMLAERLLGARVAAQSATATLSGEVVDESDSLLPGVKITALNGATSLRRQTITGDAGSFTMPLLPSGVYTVLVQREGFTPIEIRHVELNINDNRAIRITLKIGAITDSVMVIGAISPAGTRNGVHRVSAAQIDLSTATLKTTLTSQQVAGMPVAATATGRNPLTLLPFLVPGVSPTETTRTGRGANLAGIAMSVNGARPRSNSFNFQDGDNNEIEAGSALSPLPNPDALQEISVLTNSFQADEGRGIGGVINAVMKSGSSQWHGGLRYIGVNEALGARSFFDREKPMQRLHTYGGQVGGPLSLPRLYSGRDRSFFFVDYEGARWLRQRTAGVIVQLNDRERMGDFSASDKSRWPVDPLTGLPFPGGVIPQARINPISRVLLDQFYPRVRNGRRIYSILQPIRFEQDALAVRVDHHARPADSLNLTFFFHSPNTSSGIDPISDSLLPVDFKSFTRNRASNATLSETHILSPHAINQLTVAIARLERLRRNRAPGASGVAPKEFGFSGIYPQTEKYQALPAIDMNGSTVFRLDPTRGEGESAYTTWHIKDDLSHDRDAHQLRLGGDLRWFALNLSDANDNGRFVFPDMTSLMLGLPSSFSQSTGSNMNLRQSSLYLYAQDNWRFRSNLTVHLGLRYELAFPLSDQLSQTLAFRPGQQSQRFPSAPAGLLFGGDPDPIFGRVPDSIYPVDKNNLAPRIGFAYSPAGAVGWRRRIFGEGKTAIRGAWGVFYDAQQGGAFTRVVRSQPFSVTLASTQEEFAARGGTFANPYGRAQNPFPLDLSRSFYDNSTDYPLYPDLYAFDPGFRTAYSYQYNLTLQRELSWGLLAQASYVGSNTFKQHRERDMNLLRITPDFDVDHLQQSRFYPHLGSVLNQESTGRARYDALQMSLERRIGARLRFGLSYVWSKTLDNSSLAFDDSAPYPERWARSNFDRRHNFVAHYLFDLPSLKGAGPLGGFLGGWQFGGILQLRSGQPMQIFQDEDTTLTRFGPGLYTRAGIPDLVGSFRRLDPRRLQAIVTEGAVVTGNFFFDPSAFRRVTLDEAFPARRAVDLTKLRAGNLGRNLFNGPSIFQWDAMLLKQLMLRGTHVFELRTDITNLLNHALFENPRTELGSPPPFSAVGFGQVTSAGPGRAIQISLRYGF